jgi:predicted Zn-dependent protease
MAKLTFENYVARADAARAKAVADTDSPFTIEVWFLGGLTQTQRDAFAAAADRWVQLIVGDLPDAAIPTMAPEEHPVDDVLIFASGEPIDGVGKILGQAGAMLVRPASAGAAAFLPALGTMAFDTDDLARMESAGTLVDVITHEMGHVLGIGRTIWSRKGLLRGADTDDPRFTGAAATAEYRTLFGSDTVDGVPVENTGGPGTRNSHWREALFHNELMSSRIGSAGNPISRVTVASLRDIGYQVDLEAAEPYSLPDVRALAERGALVPQPAPIGEGTVLEVIPAVVEGDQRVSG